MRNVAKYLRNCGHDITMLVERDAAAEFGEFPKIVVPHILSKSAIGFLFHMFVLPMIAKVSKYDIALILAGNRRFLAYGRLPDIGVVHDLSQYRVGEKYDFVRMFYLTKIQPYLGRRLTKIVAISKSTKADIEKYWKVKPDKVVLNYNGMNRLTEPDNSVLEKFGLRKYVLYVARLEHPGKNHVRLIEAYEKLPEAIRRDCKLVLTGPDWSGSDVIKARAKESPCRNDIVFTGFTTFGEMSALYRYAAMFVMPSLSEGFGLPILEAMSVGTPCVCSNTSALAEIAADAALTCNPESAGEISAAMEKIFDDDQLRCSLIEKGYRRCSEFDWEKHTKKLVEICRSVYEDYARLEIFSVPFQNRRIGEVVDMLDADIDAGRRKKIAFLNTHYLNTAYKDKTQVERLKKFDYVFPDGSGVSLACKILGYPYRDNLNGTDMLLHLCVLSEKKGRKMYFFGGKDGVADKAVFNLKKRFPYVKIAGARSGFFTKEQEPEIIAHINALKPDMLFVGFGAPLQEKWVLENFDKLNCPLVFAIGGVVDVYSGNLSRNPVLRNLGLEWLGRLMQEPVRLFGRYVIGNPLFVLRVIKQRLTRSRKGRVAS